MIWGKEDNLLKFQGLNAQPPRVTKALGMGMTLMPSLHAPCCIHVEFTCVGDFSRVWKHRSPAFSALPHLHPLKKIAGHALACVLAPAGTRICTCHPCLTTHGRGSLGPGSCSTQTNHWLPQVLSYELWFKHAISPNGIKIQTLKLGLLLKEEEMEKYVYL